MPETEKPAVNFQSLKRDITSKASLVAGNLTQESTEIEVDALRKIVTEAFDNEHVTKDEKVKLIDLLNLCFDIESRKVERVSEEAQQELDRMAASLGDLQGSRGDEMEAIEHLLRSKGHELQMNANLRGHVVEFFSPWQHREEFIREFRGSRTRGDTFHAAADVLKTFKGEHVAALFANYSRLRAERDELNQEREKNYKLRRKYEELQSKYDDQDAELRKLRHANNGKSSKKSSRAAART